MNSRRVFLRNAALLGATAFVSSTASVRAASAVSSPSSEPLDFWEIVHSRRSVRRFRTDVPVPEEHLTRILDAARMSATSGNQQPWKFVVIRNPSKITELKEACMAAMLSYYDKENDPKPQTREEFRKRLLPSYEGYFSAPVYVVILTDNGSKYPTYNHYDGPLAATTLMLAARALGYGTVFLTDTVPDSVTKSVLKIPDTYTRVCITPIGVPVSWPNAPRKRPLQELIVKESF